MTVLPKLTRLAICSASVLLPLATASADQLDWDTINTTANPVMIGLTNTYTVGSTKVTVAISGNTSEVTTTTSGGPYTAPAVGKEFTGGTNPIQNSLELAADFTSNTHVLTVNVSFTDLSGAPKAVSGVNFDIYDIDAGGTTAPSTTYIDQIRGIQATLGVATLNPTTVTGTSGGNTVTGSGSTFAITGLAPIDNTTGGANGTINFGTQSLTSFKFSWGDDTTNAPADPVRQVIGVHDINFTQVPEPTTASMIALGGLLSGMVFFRRASRR